MSHSIHGTSPFIQGDDILLHEADYEDFAPAGCSCCSCCVSTNIQARTFFRIYDNRIVINQPTNLNPCCGGDLTIRDNVNVIFYDRFPFRTGGYFYGMPFTCCGAPKIQPNPNVCCCIDCSGCFGQGISTQEHCCATAMPFHNGLKNVNETLSALNEAVSEYQEKHNIPSGERATILCGTLTVKDTLGKTSDSDSGSNDDDDADDDDELPVRTSRPPAKGATAKRSKSKPKQQ